MRIIWFCYVLSIPGSRLHESCQYDEQCTYRDLNTFCYHPQRPTRGADGETSETVATADIEARCLCKHGFHATRDIAGSAKSGTEVCLIGETKIPPGPQYIALVYEKLKIEPRFRESMLDWIPLVIACQGQAEYNEVSCRARIWMTYIAHFCIYLVRDHHALTFVWTEKSHPQPCQGNSNAPCSLARNLQLASGPALLLLPFTDSVVVDSVRKRVVSSAEALCIGLSILVLLLCLMFRIFTRAHRESRRVRRFADANECPVLIEDRPTSSTPPPSPQLRGVNPTIMLSKDQVGEWLVRFVEG